MTRRLLEGSEAIAEAMVAAGCRFFSGYPMTPFTEVLEHMARLLPIVGGVCMNAESELEAVGMAWGASAGGVRAATGSVGQGLSLMQESLSEMCFAQLPLVVINMARGQGDYFQATRGGGHGDYRHIVLAPSDLPEAMRLVPLAFHLSDTWRNPVTLLGDYFLAHVQEAVDTEQQAREMSATLGPPPAKPWALDGSSSGTGNARIVSPIIPTKRTAAEPVPYGRHLELMADRVSEMASGVEPLCETGYCDDADLVVAAYGTPARYVRYTVAQLRAQGLRIGFVRPVTLWPFPTAAVAEATRNARAVAVFELNTGQMLDDVRLAVRHAPVEFIGQVSFDESAFGIAPALGVDSLAARLTAVYERTKA